MLLCVRNGLRDLMRLIISNKVNSLFTRIHSMYTKLNGFQVKAHYEAAKPGGSRDRHEVLK